MKNEIKLSVIIPCYNVEKFIDNLIECLSDVDSNNIEYIFINDGSTDKTKDKLLSFCKKDKRAVLLNQKNQGAALSRNNGIKISKGKYIIFIDSDDFIKPDSLKLIIEALEKENADILCIKSKHVNENYNYSKQRIYSLKYEIYDHKDLEKIFIQAMAMKGVYIGSPHMFVKKEIIHKLPNYPNVFKDVIGEDAQYNLNCLELGKTILVSNDVYYYYRQRKGSLMHSKFNEKLISILSCNDKLLNNKYSSEVKTHTLARNYLNSIYVLKKMINSKYKNVDNIKFVYSIFSNNRKYLRKAREFIWGIRLFTPLCTPYFYLCLRSKIK